MASRLPWFRMHQDDWLAHARLRRCSVEARGVWIDLICMMRQEESGTLVDDVEGMARSIGLPVDRLLALLEELRRRDVAEVTIDGARVSVTSRRVHRDLQEESRERDQTAERTREYRARRRDAAVTPVSRSCDAPVTPPQRSCDAAVTLESQNQSQSQTQNQNGSNPGLRHDQEGQASRGECTRCREGFDAERGKCCTCPTGRARARRLRAASEHERAHERRKRELAQSRGTPGVDALGSLLGPLAARAAVDTG